MNVKKVLPLILLLLTCFETLFLGGCENVAEKDVNTEARNPRYEERPSSHSAREKTVAGLDRTTETLKFSKHARCRMDCRQISEQEVKAILANGEVNFKKTRLDDPRGPTYALEGYTNDRQHVRIIFAPKKDFITVVTVIDLEVEHACACS